MITGPISKVIPMLESSVGIAEMESDRNTSAYMSVLG